MRGGVVSRVSVESLNTQIHRILSESTFTYISCGRYGFVFKVTYHGNDSGFVNHDKEKEQVREFVIKVQSIDMNMSYEEEGGHVSDRINWEKLITEVKMQQTLYQTSLEEFHAAACPAILYYEGITIEQLETYIKDKFIYHFYGKIPKEDYDSYHVAIILMEFVPSSDLEYVIGDLPKKTTEDHRNYWRRVQDLKNKAFTIYCMALLCGINQNDVFGRNFLLDKNDRVTIIDFGVAEEIDSETVKEIKRLVSDCRKDASNKKSVRELVKGLIKIDKYDQLKKWLFHTEWSGQPYGIELLDYPTPLPDEVVDDCKLGICNPVNTKPKRTRTPLNRYDYELLARKEAEEAEEDGTLRKAKRPWGVWGGNLHTKYEMGNRRHKKVRTRRKIYDYSFRKL
jgi:hypothetical protein